MAALAGGTAGPWAGSQARSFFETRERDPAAREAASTYVSSGCFAISTRDDDDHTFHGIVFDVELASSVPIEWLEVSGVAVRGALGTAAGGAGP